MRLLAYLSRHLSAHRKQRLLEMFPGTLTYSVLLIPFLIAVSIRFIDLADLWILGVAAIALDLYWLLRTINVVICVRRSLKKINETAGKNWWSVCETMIGNADVLSPTDITHCVLIPTYTEKYEVLRATLDAIDQQNYPEHLKVIAIITRVTDTDGWANVARLQEEFEGRFRSIIHIKDPVLPGVVVGKSAAMAYAGPVLEQECRDLGLDLSKTLLTDCDSDFRLHPQYFAYVTSQYCEVHDTLTSIWQPVPVFLNNMWKVPSAVRVMASAATQWQMFLHENPKRLVMFSSYTMSFTMAKEVGYWDDDVIPEDSRFFWKSFFKYGAALNIRPAFLPVYGDAPRAGSYSATHLSQYNQIKRWAWGASDIPYVALRMVDHTEIPRSLRLRRFRYLIFNHLAWATLPVLLFLGGALPAMIDLDYSLTTLAAVIGWITSGILTVTLLNTLVLIRFDRKICPRPTGWNFWLRLRADLQLFLYPVVGIALSVIPALEAQTRLMFGSYLEYTVTEKE